MGGGGSGLGGVRVDVIKELKFLGKFTKKNYFFIGGGGGVSGRGVWVGGGGGVRVDVTRIEVFVNIQKKKLGGVGGGGGGGQDGCDRRIEVFGKIHTKKFGGGGGGWWGGVRVDVNEELKFL